MRDGDIITTVSDRIAAWEEDLRHHRHYSLISSCLHTVANIVTGTKSPGCSCREIKKDLCACFNMADDRGYRETPMQTFFDSIPLAKKKMTPG